MRVFLRRKTDGLYWEGPEQWTAAPGEAFDFEHSSVAIEFISQHKLRGVDVFLWFGNPALDVVLPVADAAPARDTESARGRAAN